MIESHKNEKLESLIHHLAADFIEKSSSRTSMITVTRVSLSRNKKYATIFFTVFPEDKEGLAVEFVQRNVGEFRDFVEKNSRIGRLPFFKFELDLGEKNRQRMDELSRGEI